jgi:transposase
MSKVKKVRQRRDFDAEFKRDVLKMIESGRPVPEISESLGINSSMLYRWRKASLKREKKLSVSAPIEFDEEKVAMAKRIRELEMDREILKKALGIFSS